MLVSINIFFLFSSDLSKVVYERNLLDEQKAPRLRLSPSSTPPMAASLFSYGMESNKRQVLFTDTVIYKVVLVMPSPHICLFFIYFFCFLVGLQNMWVLKHYPFFRPQLYTGKAHLGLMLQVLGQLPSQYWRCDKYLTSHQICMVYHPSALVTKIKVILVP